MKSAFFHMRPCAAPRESASAARRCLPLLLLAALAGGGCAGPRVGRSMDARVPRAAETVVSDVRTGGPFYERVETSAGDVRTSVRPMLYTRIDIPEDEARLREILWPVYADHSRREHFSWRFLLAFGADFDKDKPGSRYYTWVFPFWFQGRSSKDETYEALFPAGGVVRDFLTFDRIRFALFPLWMDTQKKDVRGRHVLWPIFARVEGDGLRRWRVFPLVGAGEKEGEWKRHFVLWPIWVHARYLKEPTAGYEWALTPIYGRAERGVESSWYVIPPFFQFTFGRGKNEGQRRILAPWPLVRIEDSKDKHKRMFWPFYATAWTSRSRYTHLIWPFMRWSSSKDRFQERKDWSFAPVYFRSIVRPVPSKDGQVSPESQRLSYTRLWPLFSVMDRNGQNVLRIPDFSLHRRTGALERNLLHMGTLYTRGKEPDPKRVEHDLLWGLVRWGHGEDGYRETQLGPLFRRIRQPGADRSDWSVLGGLLGRRTVEGERRRRLFWVRY